MIFKFNRTPKVNLKRSSDEGFTLVEMLVAIGIFSVVMSISLGALLNMVNVNRQTQALKSVMNNLNFGLEAMTRDIRFGYNYDCDGVNVSASPVSLSQSDQASDGSDCQSIAVTFSSEDGQDRRIGYYLEGNQLWRIIDEGDSIIQVEATAPHPEMNVESLRFEVSGSLDSDARHPYMVMIISGWVGNPDRDDRSVEFVLQTSASQRRLP